jgi:hypothetical protein
MATKNEFNHYMFGDQTFLVSITMTTKNAKPGFGHHIVLGNKN